MRSTVSTFWMRLHALRATNRSLAVRMHSGREREGEDAVERNDDEQRLENGHLLWRETGVKTIDIEEYDHEGDGDETGYRDIGLINNAQEHPDGILFALGIVLREKARDGISEPEIEQEKIDDGESECVETVIVRTDARGSSKGVDEPATVLRQRHHRIERRRLCIG